MNGLRLLLLIETLAYGAASLVHRGIVIQGDEHATAGTAEGIIAAVLLGGLIASLPRRWTVTAAIVAQGFALLGTVVGLATIALGIGPRTVPDIAFHASIIVVLVVGLMSASRLGRAGGERTGQARNPART